MTRLLKVSDENWKTLTSIQGPTESLNDVVDRLLVETGNKDEAPETEPATYYAASIVRLLEDDSFMEDMNEGTTWVCAGHRTDDFVYIARDEETGEYARLDLEALDLFEADEGMSQKEILDWGVEQAKEAGFSIEEGVFIDV